MLDEVGSVDVGLEPDDLDFRIAALRVFVGYAGWGPGQLESELADQAWFVVPAAASDPFSDRPEELWRAVLRRQRGRVAMFAHFPADPESN